MKIYAKHLEETALEQFNSAMEQEFVVDGALMPDAHTGYALPIGAVVSTKDVIVPAWVGYDIGCGMCAIKTTFDKDTIKSNKKTIFDQIYKTIPVGVHVNNSRNIVDLGDLNLDILTEDARYAYEVGKGQHTLGTLGGGNHFIEIGYDENDTVWVIVHSGSRGVGHKIATHYMKLAKELNDPVHDLDLVLKLYDEFDEKNSHWKDHNYEKYKLARGAYAVKAINKITKSDKTLDGHYGLNINSKEGEDYINDLNWTLKFALLNRKSMITRVIKAMSYITNTDGYGIWEDFINRNHNHAELRDGLWIHRKGATHAEEGMMGVIPGNMLDGSFIVRGLGNPDSLYSSSHGAGRVLGRKEAKRKLNVEDFKESMKDIQGKIDKDTLDESPLAYKDIFEVMRLQKDLVEVVAHVKPLINIKG